MLMLDAELPKVMLVTTGGTIAMTDDGTGTVKPSLTAKSLLASVTGLAKTADISVCDFRQKPGASLTLADLLELARLLEDSANAVDGIVITQGTDTIEETSYLLDLWYTGTRPVVVTGAMRNPAQAGHDGPANLLAAVVTAASVASRDRGVLVVMADEVHDPQRVAKTHATSVMAFSSPNGGPVGYVAEGRVSFYQAAAKPRLVVPLPHEAAFPHIGIATVAIGDTGELLDSAAHLDGLVVAAMGVGHVPSDMASKLQDIAARIPVVLTSRTGSGSVLTGTYGFTGSESDLISRRLIPGGILSPLKARLLMVAALAAGATHDQIVNAFGSAGSLNDNAVWPWPTRSHIAEASRAYS
jgi:L-asparaginase